MPDVFGCSGLAHMPSGALPRPVASNPENVMG
jgi:hypothetical protein